MNIWAYVIPAVATIVVAIIELRSQREQKQTKKFREEMQKSSELRAEESRCSMQMMYATMQLSIVTSNALTGGHNNGNVEQARVEAQKAEAEYQHFLQKVAANTIAN